MKKAYKYVLNYTREFQTKIYGREFENEWIKLEKTGYFAVKIGYAWDGCSPKWRVFDWFYVGTWDGTLDRKTGLPITGLSSLLHDALLQFKEELGISCAEAADEFCREINKTDFSLRKLYCKAVRKYGPQDEDDYPKDYGY